MHANRFPVDERVRGSVGPTGARSETGPNSDWVSYLLEIPSMTFSSRFFVVLVVSIFLLSCAPVQQGVAQEQTPPPQKALADLWIDLSMGQPLVDWFNSTARPDDIARAEHPSLISMMDGIVTGQRLVVFKSAADAREALPVLADRMDILGYNLEHGPANPADEQADPIAGVKVMQELANQYGLKLAMGPDRDFALEYGVALAPYVDMFVLQVQRVQTEPETVRAFVVPLAEELRKANPDSKSACRYAPRAMSSRLPIYLSCFMAALTACRSSPAQKRLKSPRTGA